MAAGEDLGGAVTQRAAGAQRPLGVAGAFASGSSAHRVRPLGEGGRRIEAGGGSPGCGEGPSATRPSIGRGSRLGLDAAGRRRRRQRRGREEIILLRYIAGRSLLGIGAE